MSAATVTALVVFGPGTAAAAELHCQSFAYQQDAQEEWEKWGPNDPWRWDPDTDGVVCESKPSRPDADAALPDAALPAGGPTQSQAPPSSPSPAPWDTEAPWDGTHDWSAGDGQNWQGAPHPAGGVQAGAGGQAGDDDGSPTLPLAGVALGALLLTAGVNHRRRSESG